MQDFDTALEALKVAICESYNEYFKAGGWDAAEPHDGWWTPERIEFKKSRGKYSKIFTPNESIWGFVVTVHDHPKFKFGDLLKPASLKAPAMNQARGNLFDGYSGVEWVGPTYCGTKAQAENVARAEMQDPINDLASLG